MKKDLENDDDIKILVDEFYRKVQQDKDLGHIFNDVAKTDWNVHLPKMYKFWSTILFGNEGYKGNPMIVHQQLNERNPLTFENFNTWFLIFMETVDENFSGENAESIKLKASSIAAVVARKVGAY